MRRQAFTLIELMIVIAIIAIIAAIAIPNLLESRISSNEAAAATSLKSGIHPAQVQFQSGGYVDGNGNGIGDFSEDLSFMAGSTGYGGTIPLSLLPAQWNATGGDADPAAYTSATTGVPTVNGYVFSTDSVNELNFGAICAPQDEAASIGRRRFAINAGGTVYASQPSTTNALPTFDEVFGSTADFASFETAYSVYRR